MDSKSFSVILCVHTFPAGGASSPSNMWARVLDRAASEAACKPPSLSSGASLSLQRLYGTDDDFFGVRGEHAEQVCGSLCQRLLTCRPPGSYSGMLLEPDTG